MIKGHVTSYSVYKPYKNNGFTLVELLVVIVVIGILAAIVGISYQGIAKKAQETVVKSDLANTIEKIEIQRIQSGSYPVDYNAANSSGVFAKSSGTAYQYTLVGDGYCLSATTSNNKTVSYHVSSQNGSIESDVCSMHIAGDEYLTSVLVVAGGGGSGSGSVSGAGGGGAGGVIYKDIYGISTGSYSVTVGNGGGNTTNGGNSVLNDIVAIGGGAGGGGNGGSGGGATWGSSVFGTGTVGQGNNGGQKGNFWSGYNGGGGGGAGEVGGNAQLEDVTVTHGAVFGGDGGDGMAYDISGTMKYYGGGGGGASDGTYGLGGLGGGGNGGAPNGTAGAPNTGGGGGACNSSSGCGGAGGSGIVIIRYLSGSATATGGTITTSGGYTIHTFTSNGTFTVN